MWKLLFIPLLLYLAVLAGLWFAQTSLVFPAHVVQPWGPLPARAERLEVGAPDGVMLHGVRISAAGGAVEGRPLILGFGGNAWNGDAVAGTLAEIFPEHDVVAFHYRGYAPSGGRAGGRALLEDALLLHDTLVGRYRPSGIVAVGISVGTGPAARLAAERPISGAILVTPYDSLAAVAAQHYPWLPVRFLFRHEMPAAEDLARSRARIAIIAAERDELILPARTEALRRRAANLVYDRILSGAGHNDAPEHPAFRAAMRDALQRIAP